MAPTSRHCCTRTQRQARACEPCARRAAQGSADRVYPNRVATGRPCVQVVQEKLHEKAEHPEGRHMGVMQYLLTAGGWDMQTMDHPKALGDILEAAFGAVTLDCGHDMPQILQVCNSARCMLCGACCGRTLTSHAARRGTRAAEEMTPRSVTSPVTLRDAHAWRSQRGGRSMSCVRVRRRLGPHRAFTLTFEVGRHQLEPESMGPCGHYKPCIVSAPKPTCLSCTSREWPPDQTLHNRPLCPRCFTQTTNNSGQGHLKISGFSGGL